MFDSLYSSGYDDGSSGGGTLTTGILNAVTQLGTAAIQTQQQYPINQGYPYRPPTNTNSIFSGTGVYGSGSGSSGLLWFVVIIAVVVGFFAFARK